MRKTRMPRCHYSRAWRHGLPVSIALGAILALSTLLGCSPARVPLKYDYPGTPGACQGPSVAVAPVIDQRDDRSLDRSLALDVRDTVHGIVEREVKELGFCCALCQPDEPWPIPLARLQDEGVALLVEPTLRDLRAGPRHPGRTSTRATVGALLTPIGFLISRPPADVDGYAALDVALTNVASGAVSEVHALGRANQRVRGDRAGTPPVRSTVAGLALKKAMIDLIGALPSHPSP